MAATHQLASSIYARYRPLIDRYAGGLPPGFVATIIAHESGGREDVRGDPTLGELGLLQVTPATMDQFGVNADLRRDPEVNIWAGCLDVAVRAIYVYLHAPDVVVLNSTDGWKLARLGAAIGNGGLRNVLGKARAAGYVKRGDVFNGILRWANATGAVQVSAAQPAPKVLARIRAVEDMWQIGQRIGGSYGPPQMTPPPAKVGAYVVPKKIGPHLAPIGTGTGSSAMFAVAALALLGGGVYYAATRY